MGTRKATVVRRTQADENNEVVLVQGDGGYQRKPCAECPWRKENAGSFPAEAFRISAHTAYDMDESGFGCHMTTPEKPITCAGFLLQNADNNFYVRLRVMRGDIDYEQISDDDADLWENYRAMAEANGVDPDDPVLAPCRGNDEWR